ncbi:homoserine dehydrogenase [Sphingomonas sp.]|jgi:homoserine dehydrogenase|uniref:homoserine dehydrogenase n=1 Tax=Sphingomonas sp. TaxID=28214 RepID=UPI0025ECB86F|nr:homoserine dehydrogenase [Sphingomonas sp.]
MDQLPHPAASPKRLCVLKFGSSVLETEGDYAAVANEVYRHVREGEKVVAVVSALAGETDALLNQGMRVGGEQPLLLARVARTGELHSAALLALALGQIGVRACTLDPHEMGLVAEGDPLDSTLTGLDAEAVLAKLELHDALVVPGFTAGHATHGIVTLGRGGTDLSAVFFAARLDAHRVRLIKDVDGVYDQDPARNPLAERYAQLSYEEAAKASAGLIQPKAIQVAQQRDVLIEVAAMGSAEETTIANLPLVKSLPLQRAKLRVALLGCGTVGAGVMTYLLKRPDLFVLNRVLVRSPDRRDQPVLYTDSLAEAMTGEVDIVVETMGGAHEYADALCDALRGGTHVVTANKAVVAAHYDALHACAAAGNAKLLYSGAVGGGAPVLEAVGRLAKQPGIVALDGVVNGTVNFLLARLANGWSFDQALAKAQELGFAEADPTSDVDGHDAAYKLSLLVRDAMGVALPSDEIPKDSLRSVTAEAILAALAKGQVLKQVSRARLLPDGKVEASVRIESLPGSHPLARVTNTENSVLITAADGTVHEVHGHGAGRWPTAASVFADIMDLQRAAPCQRSAPTAGSGVVPLRMSV